MESEKFCLKWNDFQNNISESFKELREDRDFCDVTLVSDGNQFIKAHKVVLAASSSVFMGILRSNKHSDPLIYMRGIKVNFLSAIVDFIYYGETNIYQEDLDSFLVIAQELQLKGLAGAGPAEEEYGNEVEYENPPQNKINQRIKQDHSAHNQLTEYIQNEFNDTTSAIKSKARSNLFPVASTEHSAKKHAVLNTISESLNETLDSMIEKVDGIWKCKVCGKSNNLNKRNDVRRHAETHMEGVSHSCNLCGKEFRCSENLRKHVKTYH